MKNAIKFIVYPFAFVFGWIYFLLTKKTISTAYSSLRFLFVKSNGKTNDFFSNWIKIFIPQYDFSEVTGVLGDLDSNTLNEIVSQLEEDGYYIFKTKLPEAKLNSIVEFASNTPVSYLKFEEKNIAYSDDKVIFDENEIISPRYQFKTKEIINNQAIKELAFDESLLGVANKYLKAKPILDIVTMWWSLPFDSKAADRAAQKYHFDMDRFKFIKFFFYLTDVTKKSGPHCFIKGSHKYIPKDLLVDRRIEDGDIKKYFADDKFIEITGERGSIIAVDTRGFHKGKILEADKRLLFQIQFSNSLFGAPFTTIDGCTMNSTLNLKKKKFNRTYQLIKK